MFLFFDINSRINIENITFSLWPYFKRFYQLTDIKTSAIIFPSGQILRNSQPKKLLDQRFNYTYIHTRAEIQFQTKKYDGEVTAGNLRHVSELKFHFNNDLSFYAKLGTKYQTTQENGSLQFHGVAFTNLTNSEDYYAGFQCGLGKVYSQKKSRRFDLETDVPTYVYHEDRKLLHLSNLQAGNFYSLLHNMHNICLLMLILLFKMTYVLGRSMKSISPVRDEKNKKTFLENEKIYISKEKFNLYLF